MWNGSRSIRRIVSIVRKINHLTRGKGLRAHKAELAVAVIQQAAESDRARRQARNIRVRRRSRVRHSICRTCRESIGKCIRSGHRGSIGEGLRCGIRRLNCRRIRGRIGGCISRRRR